MDIQPLTGILTGIGANEEWEQQRQLQQLKGQWRVIVGETVAQHSCPLEVRQGTLQVATSTAIWAQNLSFERRRILHKINQRSQFQALHLKDIHFSTAQWHNRPGSRGAIAADTRLDSYQQRLQWQQHPSRLPPVPCQETQLPASVPAPSAAVAFARWSQRRQQQVKQVPACPRCSIPSPAGELQRWGVCAFCMTHHWQAEKQATQPDGQTEADSWQSPARAAVGTVENSTMPKRNGQCEPQQDDKSRFQSDQKSQSNRSQSPSAGLISPGPPILKSSLQGSFPQPRSRIAPGQRGAAEGQDNLASGHRRPARKQR